MEPDQSIFDENGDYTLAGLNDVFNNPVAIVDEWERESVQDEFQLNAFAEYNFSNPLRFKSPQGFSTTHARAGEFIPSTLIAAESINGQGTINASKNTSWQSENYLTFSKEFDKSSLEVLGGYSFQTERFEDWRAIGQGFVSNNVSFWNLGGASTFGQPFSQLVESDLISYYSRINFKLSDKYLFTLTGRYDGFSAFSDGEEFGFFPSGAVAWNLGN